MGHFIKGFREVKNYQVILYARVEMVISCVRKINWVSQLLLALKPCWQSTKMSWISRCFTMLDTTICSSTLQQMKSEIQAYCCLQGISHPSWKQGWHWKCKTYDQKSTTLTTRPTRPSTKRNTVLTRDSPVICQTDKHVVTIPVTFFCWLIS